MALDAASNAFIAEMAASATAPPPGEEIAQMRAMGVTLSELVGGGPEVADVVEETLTDGDGQFQIRILRPRANASGVLVYFHGGGWVAGDIDQYDTIGRLLSTRSDCVVVLVNYRKAPEFPFPIPLEDAWRATSWVAERVRELAGADVPLMVAGDSAGGNLAAAVAQRAVRLGAPEIALQVLVYPVLDADFERNSYRDPENQLLVSRDSMMFFWSHYVSDVARRRDPEASPLRAEDLSGLPRTLVLLAEHDPLLDEGRAYAARLRDAGVAVTEEVLPGQMHGFFHLFKLLPGGKPGVDLVVDEIAEVVR